MDNTTGTLDIDGAMGTALQHQQAGRLQQAEAIYRDVLRVQPGNPDALHLLGMVAHQTGNNEAAIALIQKAIHINPAYPFFYNNIGGVYLAMKRHDDALASYKKALSLDPGLAEAHNNIGMILIEQGKHSEALSHFLKARSLKPDYAEARWAAAMTRIPAIYGPGVDPEKCRAEFSRELASLDAWFRQHNAYHASHVVGSHQPFYLAYQEENNRDLLARYGALCCQFSRNWMKQQGITLPETAAGDVVRVGIVSAHIHEHSVWNALIKGWIQHLDPGRFAIHIFHTGSRQDEETAWARTHAASFEQGTRGLRDWVDVILETQPDILLYPEIGMDPTTIRLASMRLARVQAATWGHPETTGLPTMDYYLSAEDLEPPDAQDNYTEKLVTLPHLGCCYHSLPVVSSKPDLDGLGISREAPVLICPGTPFKYSPGHDRIFVELARKLGQCQFVFFTHPVAEFSKQLGNRLEHVFTEAGMDINDFVIFIPWQEKPSFYGLMEHANVYLDTIGFSGFNTAMQAMECALPVVTLEGHFMRGRLASGILRRMGITELIAANEDDYIELVTRLVNDAGFHRQITQKIRSSRHSLFDDQEPVRTLEAFLGNVATNLS